MSLVVYVAGACLYAAKIPERFCPGAFDYVGASHNIWHVAVLGGILWHYVAMHEFFRVAFWRARETQCSVY
jgi:adiponectin receptor